MNALIITGPTGSGKTDLALSISKSLDWRIVNADAFQFYREIPVLSNQPDDSKKFDLFADRSLSTPMSAGLFARESASYLNQKRIWVGTGLYLGATFYGLDSDRRKGTPFQGKPKVDFRMLVLDPPRAELYEALNKRVGIMMERGALEEARAVEKKLKDGEIEESNPVLKAIGLRHLLLYIREELSLEDAISLWQRDTRRLAKRQWTWLRKFCAPSPHRQWIRGLSDPSLNPILELIKNSQ